MKENFEITEWLKDSSQILKVNWLEWLIISGVMTATLLGIFYFLFQEIAIFINEALKLDKSNLEELLLSVAQRIGLFFALLFLVQSFIDIFMIHTTSQWLTGTRLSTEQTIAKVFAALPLFIILSFAYLIMAFVASIFCIIPVVFVIVFFLFIFQALIIEDQGLNSLGRSIELVKSSFGNFLVLPFLISFALQFAYTIPIILIQSLVGTLFDLSKLEKMQPNEIIDLILKSPYTLIFFAFLVLFFSLQATLKSILYTVAFEQARSATKSNGNP